MHPFVVKHGRNTEMGKQKEKPKMIRRMIVDLEHGGKIKWDWAENTK